jgi:hypothetical protein
VVPLLPKDFEEDRLALLPRRDVQSLARAACRRELADIAQAAGEFVGEAVPDPSAKTAAGSSWGGSRS